MTGGDQRPEHADPGHLAGQQLDQPERDRALADAGSEPGDVHAPRHALNLPADPALAGHKVAVGHEPIIPFHGQTEQDDPEGVIVEDTELIAAVAAGDRDALASLYERHAPWLQIRLRRRCGDDDLVAEALQETFVAAWRGAGQWRGDGAAGAWLWGIAVRRLVDLIARRPRHRPLSAAPDPVVASAEEQVLLGVEYADLTDGPRTGSRRNCTPSCRPPSSTDSPPGRRPASCTSRRAR